MPFIYLYGKYMRIFDRKLFQILFLTIIICATQLQSQNFSVSAGADLVSRYIWRGINMNDVPNIQPALSLKYKSLQLGFWGSYSLSHLNSTDQHYATSQEIDTWMSYSFELKNTATFSLLLTDYYYANAGIKAGNFNNYDNTKGPGAHLLEAGIIYSGGNSLPVSVAAYYNVYNDKGNNTYFQIDYYTLIENVGINVFAGASSGSTKTPGFYGTENFNVINFGIKATKQIKVSEALTVPAYCTYVLNPRIEASYLVFGIVF